MERSRSANEELAWKLLQEKLDKLAEEQRAERARANYQAKPEAAFGQARRTYVLDRDRRVVDHTTGVSSTNPRSVLDGDLDDFLKGNLCSPK